MEFITASTSPIRIAVVGYGNLGRGVETALGLSPDMELVGVFTRRDPQGVDTVGAQAWAAGARSGDGVRPPPGWKR